MDGEGNLGDVDVLLQVEQADLEFVDLLLHRWNQLVSLAVRLRKGSTCNLQMWETLILGFKLEVLGMELLMSEEASITTQQIPFGHVQGNLNTSQNLLQLTYTHTIM